MVYFTNQRNCAALFAWEVQVYVPLENVALMTLVCQVLKSEVEMILNCSPGLPCHCKAMVWFCTTKDSILNGGTCALWTATNCPLRVIGVSPVVSRLNTKVAFTGIVMVC